MTVEVTEANVPHHVWIGLLNRSRDLMSRAESAKRRGDAILSATLWRELSPLNARIHRLALLPSTRAGSTGDKG